MNGDPANPQDIPATPAVIGEWSEVYDLANVPIHAHLLPTGKILFWGRRNPPGNTVANATFDSLNQHFTVALLWDPSAPTQPAVPTSNQPADANGQSINIFCSGHTFLADGRLLVVGGHLYDSQGISNSVFYDPAKDQWTPGPDMGIGRWYPTAVTLPDGRALVIGGSHALGTPAAPPHAPQTALTAVPQVLENGGWAATTDFQGLPLYPRMHVAPNGFLFMSGPLAQGYYLRNFDPQNNDAWLPLSIRSGANRDYAPAVMYAPGKVLYIGGGLEDTPQGQLPSPQTETIDLGAANPAWTQSSDMAFRRRQHNAVALPDGTVLVTGGSSGTGFDNLDPGRPVHTAELWDPATGVWTRMADEAKDRCYHATTLLLPDGRVFSGGGGEYAPDNQILSNPPEATHADCQFFSPPYLFMGPRPVISQAPAQVNYGQTFDVETPQAAEIHMVTWLRLGSVTHSFNQNQGINFLSFQAGADKVTVTAPPDANACPPGHYLLFLLNGRKIPSIAVVIRITAKLKIHLAALAAPAGAEPFPSPAKSRPFIQPAFSPNVIDQSIRSRETEPPIAIGITPICPYGLSACWGGAFEALGKLRGVRIVLPMPDSTDSTGFVYLQPGAFPAVEAWPEDFAQTAKAVHQLRGAEMTVTGVVDRSAADGLVLHGDQSKPPLFLQPIQPEDKIQWDLAKAAPQPLTASERAAYQNLLENAQSAARPLRATVTGPIQYTERGYVLKVRKIALAGSR